MFIPAELDVLLRFAKPFRDALDIDPWHEIMRVLMRDWNWEQRLWFTALYKAFNQFGSAWIAYHRLPILHCIPEALVGLPCTVERRGLRQLKTLVRHLESYCCAVVPYGSQVRFITQGWGHDPQINFRCFWDRIQTVWGNGRWAAFEWTEELARAYGLPITPDGIFDTRSGPYRAMRLLSGRMQLDQATGNALAQHLLARLHADRLPYDMASLETLLCDYQAVRCGRYYVGHHIDEQLEDFRSIARLDPTISSAPLWQIRGEVLPQAYLGEHRGWHGPSLTLKRWHVRYGEIGDRAIHGDPR